MTVLVDVDQDSTHVFSREGAGQVSRKEAFLLGRRLQELAASQAGLDHDFCVLVDQFDAADAVVSKYGPFLSCSRYPDCTWKDALK